MLREKLLTKQFYLDSLSLFMKNSYGIEDRVDVYYSILKNLNDDIALGIFKRFDIFATLSDPGVSYFTENNIDEDSTEDYFLDMIANIYGLQRTFMISYEDSDHILSGVTNVTEKITLTNKQLLCLIQVNIVKDNFDGTNTTLLNLYTDTNNSVKNRVSRLGIKYTWSDSRLLSNVYFTNYTSYIRDQDINNNIIKMYLAGLLTIESLGIVYNRRCISNVFNATFDTQKTSTTQFFIDESTNVSDPNMTFGIFS